jgi:hypothetical protein
MEKKKILKEISNLGIAISLVIWPNSPPQSGKKFPFPYI